VRAGRAGREGHPQKKLTKAGQARARAARLRLAYFPPGWTEKPHQKSAGDSDPRCSYYNPEQSDLVEIGEYDSPDFQLSDGSRSPPRAACSEPRRWRRQATPASRGRSSRNAWPSCDRADVAVLAIGINRPLSTELVQFLVAKLAQQAE
jgi:hypothetical protein